MGVECEEYRVALSAQLDDEEPGPDPGRVDAHLARCGECRAWLRNAVAVTRAARLQPASDVPDLTETILRDLPGFSADRRGEDRVASGGNRARWLMLARAGLFVVAAAQCASGVGALFGAGVTGFVPVHSARELGSFALALAVAWTWIAWRPARAGAYLPMLATLVGVLAAFTAVDLLAGHASPASEAGHLPLVAGLVLTLVLARNRVGHGRPPSAGAGKARPWHLAADNRPGWVEGSGTARPGFGQAFHRWVA